MIVSELHIHNLRNIISTRISLNPRFNLITGSNGSGKTSFLEALYLLGCGHSFRSRDISSIIHYGQKELTVFARLHSNETISIQKSIASPTIVKINQQSCFSSSQLAYMLPTQIFYQDIFQIITAGATVRRAVMDWGLFHVKQSYFELWKNYKRVLKQRNALLRQQGAKKDFEIWNKQLADLAVQLDALRSTYFMEWVSLFNTVLATLSEVRCTISYFKGWDKKNTGVGLDIILDQNLLSDQQRGYTQYGAHNYDLLIETSDHKAKNTLSRGQQKIILIALKLAQTLLMNKPCLYLLDDITAELDASHQSRLFNFLRTLNGQFVITNIEPLPGSHPLFDGNNYNSFTINEGFT